MPLFRKIKWILGILLVLALIVTTNLVDRKNFNRVKNSVITIYEARLVANDLIIELLKSVHEKELAFKLSDSTFFKKRNITLNNAIEDYLTQFGHTSLTPDEKIIFTSLTVNFSELKNSEKHYYTSETNGTRLLNNISKVKESLNALAEIQTNEGKRQVFLSTRALDTVELFTKIEIFIMILLSILMLIIILYKPKNG